MLRPDLKTRLSFRPAQQEDYESIRRITLDAYLQAGYVNEVHPYARILGDVARRAACAQVWVVESDGQLVGTVMLTAAGQPYTEVARGREIEFRMLAVAPAMQGQGVGRAMVKWIVDHVRALGNADAVVLTSAASMAPAHRLYESLGFRRMPDRDWSFDDTEKNLWVFQYQL